MIFTKKNSVNNFNSPPLTNIDNFLKNELKRNGLAISNPMRNLLPDLDAFLKDQNIVDCFYHKDNKFLSK